MEKLSPQEKFEKRMLEWRRKSKKHHYIPRFYLEGFTNEKGKFFIYDKLLDKSWCTNPENSFCENDRNTSRINDPKTGKEYVFDFAEDALSKWDDKAAGVIHEITNSLRTDSILTSDRAYILRFFMTMLFWRTPANDAIRENIIENVSFEQLGIGLFNKETKQREIEYENAFKGMDIGRKLYPGLLPLISFSDGFSKANAQDSKLYYRDRAPQLITDNPVVLKEYVDLTSFHDDYIFPISSQVVLVSTTKYKPPVLPPLFSIKLDMLLFQTAGRYVACADEHYLHLLTEEYKKDGHKPGRAKQFKNEIFGYFY